MAGTQNKSRSLERQITTQDIDCLREAFALFDINRKEEITTEELGKVLGSHGFTPSEDDLKRMIKKVDETSKGGIDFSQFIELMVKYGSNIDEDIAQSFKVFDRDGDGLITKDELQITMSNLGEPMNEAEVKAMIAEADLDGDGKINYREFQQLMDN